jgi:hypothetical protein
MRIQETEPVNLPSPEFSAQWERWTASSSWGVIAIKAKEVVQTLVRSNQVPPEAIITFWEYEIISQEWLKNQPPASGFFEEWQELNPSPDQTDNTKRQCWINNGVYTYNELGSDWTLKQLWARTLDYDEIIEILKSVPGENNPEKMQKIGVTPIGWRNANYGRFVYWGITYLRSRSPDSYGNMLTALLHTHESHVRKGWFYSSAGMVPFGVMDKKVPA